MQSEEATGKRGKPLTPWQEFCRERRLEGLGFPEIVSLWRKRGEVLRSKNGAMRVETLLGF